MANPESLFSPQQVDELLHALSTVDEETVGQIITDMPEKPERDLAQLRPYEIGWNNSRRINPNTPVC